MRKPASLPPSPTHLGRHITRCPKGIHTAVVFSRAGDTRAHPWTFALFAFTTFTEKRKIRTIFNPKPKTKTAQKNVRHFHKNVRDSHKNVGGFWKNVGDFPENVGRFSWNTRKSSQLNPDTSSSQPQNRGKESHLPKTSLLPSTFSIASTENPSVILHQNPPFQPSISPFQPAFS